VRFPGDYGLGVVAAPPEWNPRLHAGGAPYYARGRLPYPPEIASILREELSLDGTGRLIDVGCGPGSIAILLAPLFAEVVGVDPDPGMLDEAASQASQQGITNTRWVQVRAEALPANLGVFAVATFAQSFHWMQREQVARTVREMLDTDGSWVHVSATTHEGLAGVEGLRRPSPPRRQIAELVHGYLGATRRDGVAGEDAVMVAAGFRGRRRVTVAGHVHERTEDQAVASVFSLSWAAPHLFGARFAEFEADLRGLLRETSPEGHFSEKERDIELVIWAK
jgi:SAM-dependent methyltransferase